ncbi:MAG: ABC transporter ATP-binding protein [Thermoleophilia bacterium]|nr:ABC transporter ATP-binding protein [Thermoleophilia bacterium]
MTEPIISLRSLSKRFDAIDAVDRVDLAVERGEFLALLGPSGCGKTTLLRLVAGFEEPDAGTVEIDGEPVAGGGVWVRPDRRSVGMVFQDYALFPHLSVEANVGFGLPRRERAARVAETLDLVGLAGHGPRFPHELSGGQQQRVALARAIAPQPAIVLLDEPWSNIDPLLRTSMREELASILRAVGVTVVLVTHEREEAFSIADRIALMHDGRVVQAGIPEDVYYKPATRWAATFVGAANFLPAHVVAGRAETELGTFAVLAANGHHAVDVLVRPERLELRPDTTGPGTVVAREFRGHDVFYRVRLADGSELVSQRPSTEAVSLGARVAIRAHAGTVTAFDTS